MVLHKLISWKLVKGSGVIIMIHRVSLSSCEVCSRANRNSLTYN